MRRLRVAHRLCAVAAVGTGLVVLHDGFTGDITDHWPIFLVWVTACIAVTKLYRRMGRLARHVTKEN